MNSSIFLLLWKCPEDAWDKIFDINVKAAFLLAKSTVPYMEKRGKGSIVFVSSIAGFQPISVTISEFLKIEIFKLFMYLI